MPAARCCRGRRPDDDHGTRFSSQPGSKDQSLRGPRVTEASLGSPFEQARHLWSWHEISVAVLGRSHVLDRPRAWWFVQESRCSMPAPAGFRSAQARDQTRGL